MKYLLLFFLGIFPHLVMAEELKVEINPPRPVAGEVFQAYFRVFTESDEDPVINFSPSNIEVVGKSNQGISTRTVYANGKLTVSREITIAYDLVSARPGSANLRDIIVQVSARTLRHPSITLTILKEAEERPEVFLMADVPKKTLFLGEGVVVRYWLYSKGNITNSETKKYPKLNSFLKRFLQEPDRGERYLVNGEVYQRNLVYAARLYPEKTGELIIDPAQVAVTYSSTRSMDPFGAFGLQRDFKTKTLNSETVKLTVLPLPQPVPPHFTGLIGKHDFDLQMGQNKLIVNEPLEVKLTVTGPGALENLEPPELIKHPGLEEFETNGDLKIMSPDQATKVFDYTFLAKENLRIPSKTLILSYFDPQSERYVPQEFKISEIIVAGGENSAVSKENKTEKITVTEKNEMPKAQGLKDFSAPVSLDQWEWKAWLPYINISLGILALILSIGWLIQFKNLRNLRLAHDVPASFKVQFNFSDFVKWLTPLIKESGKSPALIVKDSDLPEDSKRYFIDLLIAHDNREYSAQKIHHEYKYQASHFKKLAKYIESAQNESSS
jgi:hypothetical protein